MKIVLLNRHVWPDLVKQIPPTDRFPVRMREGNQNIECTPTDVETRLPLTKRTPAWVQAIRTESDLKRLINHCATTQFKNF